MDKIKRERKAERLYLTKKIKLQKTNRSLSCQELLVFIRETELFDLVYYFDLVSKTYKCSITINKYSKIAAPLKLIETENKLRRLNFESRTAQATLVDSLIFIAYLIEDTINQNKWQA